MTFASDLKWFHGTYVFVLLCLLIGWAWYLTLYICIIDERKRNESCEANPHGTVFHLV